MMLEGARELWTDEGTELADAETELGADDATELMEAGTVLGEDDATELADTATELGADDATELSDVATELGTVVVAPMLDAGAELSVDPTDSLADTEGVDDATAVVSARRRGPAEASGTLAKARTMPMNPVETFMLVGGRGVWVPARKVLEEILSVGTYIGRGRCPAAEGTGMKSLQARRSFATVCGLRSPTGHTARVGRGEEAAVRDGM